MAQNTKTPAMVLQEFTVKGGYSPPEYILTLSKTGTHENEFHYRVVVAGINGKGFGRSKQVAKHSAASNALEILALEGLYDPSSNPSQGFNAKSHRNESDSPLQPPVNYIGTLKDMCCEFKLPYPDFIEISDVGPPHCREFTYECRMSSITTQATANTKKQAKQLAAKDMVGKIQDICPELAEQWSNSITENDQEIVKKYVELSGFQNVIPNKAAKIENYTITLKQIMNEKGLTFEDFKEQFGNQNWENFLYILDKLDLKYNIHFIQKTPVIMVILSLSLDTPFSVMGVGSNDEEAMLNAVIQSFRIMETYMTVTIDDAY